MEYCFQCSLYPCDRYHKPSQGDSFITYKNVIGDLEEAKKTGIGHYQDQLNRKIKILESLIKNYNEGRRKNFYCLAVNLIEYPHLEKMMKTINRRIQKMDIAEKEKIKLVIKLIESIAQKENVKLTLRK